MLDNIRAKALMQHLQNKHNAVLPNDSYLTLPAHVERAIESGKDVARQEQLNAKTLADIIPNLDIDQQKLDQLVQKATAYQLPFNTKPNAYKLLQAMQKLSEQNITLFRTLQQNLHDAKLFVSKAKPVYACSFERLMSAAQINSLIARHTVLQYKDQQVVNQPFFDIDNVPPTYLHLYAGLGIPQNFGSIYMILSRSLLDAPGSSLTLKSALLATEDRFLSNCADATTQEVLATYLALTFPNGVADYLAQSASNLIEIHITTCVSFANVERIILPSYHLAAILRKTFPFLSKKIVVAEPLSYYVHDMGMQ